MDLDRDIFYRKPIGKRATRKRQTPAPIPPRLLAHMRRWKERKLMAHGFVEFNGKAVTSLKKGFRRAVQLAGAATSPPTLPTQPRLWLMRRGVPIREAARFLGMSPEVLQDTYGHHITPRLPPTGGHGNRPKRPIRFGIETVVNLTEEGNETKNLVKSGRSGRI